MNAACSTSDGRCPRCGQLFHCGIDDPGPCPCTSFTLDGATLAALNREYHGCLCMRCLAELAAPPAPAATPSG